MKHTPNLQDLLDRYWEGETTLEEERWLKSYFETEEHVPEQYRRESELFRALKAEQAISLPSKRATQLPRQRFGWLSMAAALALLLTAGMVWWMSRPSATVLQQPVAQQQRPPVATPETPPGAPSLAAETAPAPVEKPMVKPRARRTPPADTLPAQAETDTYEDPEKALAEIKAVLALVSSKINKGKNTLDKGLQEVDNVDILLKKNRGTSG